MFICKLELCLVFTEMVTTHILEYLVVSLILLAVQIFL